MNTERELHEDVRMEGQTNRARTKDLGARCIGIARPLWAQSEEISLSYALNAVIAVAICRTNASNVLSGRESEKLSFRFRKPDKC